MASPLSDRLEAARRQRFVGRAAEQTLFQSALTAPELPFYVLHVFGPGGVGKSTLLRHFSRLASEANAQVIHLDGRNVDASPDFFQNALQRAMGLDPAVSPLQALSSPNGRWVLLIDTYEMLAPLDGWLRDVFLPQLPGNVITILAGRNPPSIGWRTDPGWEAMIHVLPLRNLEPEEGHDYLLRRQVPADQHQMVLEFTHGHPLALSLVADAMAQRPGTRFQPEDAPDVIRVLLEQFVQKVPGPAHRAALEACALVRLTTEPLLAHMLDIPEVLELFQWLRGLSFIEAERRGIFPHDLAREALTADLRWRNPDWYRELHERARAYYLSRLQQGSIQEQQQILSEYIFLHRDNALVRPYFEWQESGQVFADAMRPADREAVLAMVAQHEGQRSAELAAHWLDRQPQGASVFRDASGQPRGLLLMVSLDKTTPADRALDPAIEAATRYLAQHAPLRPNETATHFRFWLAADSYQGVSPIQSRIFINIIQHYLTTPGLAYTFFPCADPDFWVELLAYADLARQPEADFTVDGRRYGVYGHDWRVTPPLAWLDLMAQRELGLMASVKPPPPQEQLLVLSRTEFDAAVREALKAMTTPAVLATNPLLRSRLVAEEMRASGKAERTAALQNLLKAAAETLQKSPRQAKFYRALYHTYFRPAVTQEQAAELLDLPFSTFRRHLAAGIQQVTEILWQKEVGGLENE
ncbi:MAG: ATP-binding protein [Chloroflexi bacterium]|nr:ATP-binding protein [Chloroflexota bacterium]MCI0726747.1 ATP-binding protein [Chloroflexota bacterium]